MPSITTWTRLEPHCRRADMRASLQARVHDPLWLLGRQWQFGEFRGTDGGSPVIARFRAECSRLNHYVLGLPARDASVAAKEYKSDALPLEVLAERERIRAEGGPRLRLAAEAGLQFLRLLAREGISEATRAAYVSNYPLETPAPEKLDGEALRFLSIMRGRVPDGVGIYEDVRDVPRQPDGTPSELPAEGVVSAGERHKVARAVGRWLKWIETLFSEPARDESAWSAERMEYGFAVATRMAEREVVLTAREYAGGHLDWSAFSVDPSVSLAVPAEAEPETITATCIPAPVTFRGMPAARWWEFEDAQVDLGAIEADPEDLARLLLVEFASIYGNDWFEVPIDLKVGSICWPRSLVVVDTFGERTLIRPYTEVDSAGAPAWRMFHLSPDFFFLAPVLASSLRSAPIEDVLFLRDEMANMAWAVERIVETPAGRRLRRFEAFQEKQGRRREGEGPVSPEEPPGEGGPLVYRLVSSVPPYWIPFLPQKVDGRSIRLRRGTMLQPDGSPLIPPKGRILEPNRALSLFEEEVPRAGARVTRAYQYARWIDGSTHLWIGRRKRPGRGEGSSGLRFDIVEPA